jgi:predicted Fe-S protein YdhL (DUF1289 family)
MAADLEANEMTPNQRKAIWELCRQGLHEVADQAERAWTDGRALQLNSRTPVAREVAQLVRICNWELQPEPAQSEAA